MDEDEDESTVKDKESVVYSVSTHLMLVNTIHIHFQSAVPVLKRKAVEVIPVVTKQVRIASALIDFEEELEHASVLLDEVRDEAMVVSEWVQAVYAHLQDLDGWGET